jgi:hypothetical protein
MAVPGLPPQTPISAELRAVLARLPARFYVSMCGVPVVAWAGGSVVRVSGASSGGHSAVVVLATLAGVAILIRQAVIDLGSALPSPERRAAWRETGAPPPDRASSWVTDATPAVERGRALAVRLRSDALGGTPVHAAVLTFVALLGCWVSVSVFHSFTLGDRGWPSRVAAWVVPVFALAVVVTLAGSVMRRARGLTVELSAHPLRAGGRYRLEVGHPDPVELRHLRISLVSEEEASNGREGKRRMARQFSHRLPVHVEGTATASRTLSGDLRLPECAVPTTRTGYRRVGWYVAVGLGRWLPWTFRYWVTVEPSALAGLRGGSDPAPSRVLEDGPVTITLDEGSPVFAPGASLSGCYEIRPSEAGPLRSTELSVLWTTGGPGTPELGVCHYEGREAVDGDDLGLYGARRFDAPLPVGPFSYDGAVVKVRWAVRLRLRYARGGELVRELPFRLGAAEPVGTPAVY